MSKQKEESHYQTINELLFLSWHTEAFARQKQLPRFEKIIRDVERKRKFGDISQEDQLLIAMAKSKGVNIKKE